MFPDKMKYMNDPCLVLERYKRYEGCEIQLNTAMIFTSMQPGRIIQRDALIFNRILSCSVFDIVRAFKKEMIPVSWQSGHE